MKRAAYILEEMEKELEAINAKEVYSPESPLRLLMPLPRTKDTLLCALGEASRGMVTHVPAFKGSTRKKVRERQKGNA